MMAPVRLPVSDRIPEAKGPMPEIQPLAMTFVNGLSDGQWREELILAGGRSRVDGARNYSPDDTR